MSSFNNTSILIGFFRLSRGRRVIENAFGILSSRWRIFRKPIIASLKTTENIIKATICLHNFLIHNSIQYLTHRLIDVEDNDGDIIEGQWRYASIMNNLTKVGRLGSNYYCRAATNYRDMLASYFMTTGSVPFQWNK